VAADLSIIKKRSADDKINSGSDPNGHVAKYLGTWTFGQGPQLPGLSDLTTYAATSAIASGLRGNLSPIYTIGANADQNADNDLSAAEASPLFPSVVAYAAKRAWLVLRDFSSAEMTMKTVPGKLWGSRTVLTYNAVAAPTPQMNDIVVTQSSANPVYGTSLGNVAANHGTVKSGSNVRVILDKTIPLR
jgi:hypothetical protein